MEINKWNSECYKLLSIQLRQGTFSPLSQLLMRICWAHFLEKWTNNRVRDSCVRKRVEYRI